MTQDNYLSPVAPDANTQTFTDLVWLVFRLNGALLHWGDAVVEPLGLTGARWQTLGVISLTARPLTAPQIGQAMGVTRQGAQKQLNLLLEQGLVESRPNPSHQRSPLYALTPRGSEVHEQAVTLWMEHATEIANQLSPTKIRGACATLEVVLHHFSRLEKQEA